MRVPVAALLLLVLGLMGSSLGPAHGEPQTWGAQGIGSSRADAVAPVLRPGDQLHIQFAGDLRIPSGTTVVELDAETTSAAVVSSLRESGLRTVCYISAGSWERYRPDANDFPARLRGRKLVGWPKERWLDIRKRAALKPILRKRIASCARKGFDGVEFDNVDGYQNRTGFAIKRRQQLRFNRMLADMAKSAGLSPGLKNALALIRPLSKHFDWALNEECVTYRECAKYRDFTDKGKAVAILEYGDVPYGKVCRTAARVGAQAQIKRLSLSAWTRYC